MNKNAHIITNAVLLKVSPSSEINKNFTFISPDIGIHQATAYGASKHKSRFCSTIQPFISAKLFLYRSPKSNYLKLDDISDIKSNEYINGRLEHIYLSSFYADVLLNSYLSAEEFKNYFFLLSYSLEILNEQKDIHKSFLFFSSKYIFLSGYHFCLDKCMNCGGLNDSYYFNFEDGGNFCEKHLKNRTFRLTAAASKLWLDFLEKKYIKLKNINTDMNDFNLLFPVISHIIKIIFEKELKTFKFIKNIF